MRAVKVVCKYARPRAFDASSARYRDNVGYSGGSPATMLSTDADPLFPLEWVDDLHA